MSKGAKGTKVVDGLYYTKEHEWAKVQGDVVVVGITDYAQNALHEITFVEIKEPGTAVTAGEECGLVESMKASSDVFSPVSGQITEVNTALDDAPEIVNADPYGKGWMCKIKSPSLKQDLKKLMDSKAYSAFVASLK
jgi:glycine cleavage system H protein